ncbi:MAG TPA: sugar transferase [Anaerolineaceae bacterium]|nr:sugar transferase [Anaerolineaceae bacterium]
MTLKPVVDALLALLLLMVTSPLFVIFALGITLHSPGPIFYFQDRIGLNGKPFRMIKFRSMRVNADQNLHKEYVQSLIRNNIRPEEIGKETLKMESDPRITGLGKVLRGFGMDELPQLINVLRGEMSIVGPRPSLAYEFEMYDTWHEQRLSVLPGITGLWQVTAHNRVPFDEMVRIDLDYIRKANLWLDLKIMLLTPIEMLRKKG